MDKNLVKHFLTLLMLLVHGISTESNSTLPEEVRQSRSNRRVVKLYSGQRPTPMLCEEEGFFADPNDCAVFHQCMTMGNGRLKSLRIRCAPGTIFDPDTKICNHPQMTRRSDCGGRSLSSLEVSFENEVSKEIPTPIKANIPVPLYSSTKNHSHQMINSDMTKNEIKDNDNIPRIMQLTDTNILPQKLVITTMRIYTSDPCTESGFLGYSDDCKKFYRCVEDGTGNFNRYEFTCSDGTVWDSQLQSCNYAEAVKECGGRNNETHKIPPVSFSDINYTTQSTTSNLHSITRLTTSTSKYLEFKEEETGDENDIPYGGQSQTIKPVTNKPILTSTAAIEHLSDDKCTTSGFMGDKTDCKKFYRCVDNNNGGYTRYDFSCGPGTVWDSKIQSCNHEWAVEKCGENSEINKEETTTAKEIDATFAPSTTQIQHNISSTDITSTTFSPAHTTSKTTTITAAQITQISNSNSESICNSSGFVGDNRDCKKFYRCVNDGNGGYTKYEFYCGEGTVWDPKIQTCNYAHEVESCGNQNTEIQDMPSSETTSVVNDDENQIGYPNQNDDIMDKPETSSTSTTHSTPTDSNTNNKCIKSGFMGDNQNCKKFYRCVEDTKGGYTRHEFTCGEGTAWDQTIEACNFEWAVKDCRLSENENANLVQTTQLAPSSSEMESLDQGYNQQTTSITTSQPSPSVTQTGSDQCTQEGFYGVKNDCKKFFRCVDNGQGKLVKYDFICGEGTIWDQDIQACDHESSNKQCGSSVFTTKLPNYDNDEIPAETTKNESTSFTTASTTTSGQSQDSVNICTKEGFFGDSKDCRKFYRCVDNGKGGFTKYDFTCGESTAWDQELLGCNHINENSSCFYVTTSNLGSTSQTSRPTTTQKQDGTTNRQEHGTTEKQEHSNIISGNDRCTAEGFYANINNCKKFYRCVDNGKGGLTKYDFTCGEGTIWVQEIQACDHDNDITGCGSGNEQQTLPITESNHEQSQSSTPVSSTSSEIEAQRPDHDVDSEFSNSNQPSSSSDKCQEEGFYPNKDDCTRFYRCVGNGQGGYTKYDFKCGEATAWDVEIQNCNHISQVKNCQRTSVENSQPKPIMNDEEAPTSGTTENTVSSSETSKPASDKCEQEGYYGNSNDCSKFYRCVDNGNGGLTKYDFDCGEGTIWDQDLLTCNHPQDVTNPSCKGSSGSSQTGSSTTSSTSDQSSTSTSTSSPQSQSTATHSQTTEKSDNDTDCSQENSSKKPTNQEVKCEKAGYYANPDDCKKFYRCVDWDGNGERFSVYHFDCGEGTIWDPQLETCNHEDSVYPPRDCSSKQSENVSQGSTTTKKTPTQESSTTKQTTTSISSTTTEQTTQQPTSSENTTTQQTTSSEQTTTQQTTTNKPITTQQTTINQPTTTQQSTTSEQTTTEQSTTSEQTTTQQSTTSEKTTTQQSTTSEQTTTQQSTTSETTEQTTIQQSTTSEQTTTQQATTSEQTTTQQSTAIEETTTQQFTTTDQTTTQLSTSSQETTTANTEQQPSTTEQTSNTTEEIEQTDQSTAENTTPLTTTTDKDDSSTTESQESSSEKECPETENDQYLYVCPTSFRRHPKYCNMFYQCTEDDDSHDIKFATFTCPNNTIYDEGKVQCVDEDKADKKCNGQKAKKYRMKRKSNYSKEPMEVGQKKFSCRHVGNYPFESNECSSVFLKCQDTKTGKLRGIVHKCPEGYMYWSISKRCEKKAIMRGCNQSPKDWSKRWEIPLANKRDVSK